MPIASIFNYIGVIVLVVLVLILVVSNIHVVQQSRAYSSSVSARTARRGTSACT